jgi:hypothetical protein
MLYSWIQGTVSDPSPISLQGGVTHCQGSPDEGGLTILNSQGGEDTFGENQRFTRHLRQLVSEALPKIEVRVLVYPTYDTRGDLGQCVSQFRDWWVKPHTAEPANDHDNYSSLTGLVPGS